MIFWADRSVMSSAAAMSRIRMCGSCATHMSARPWLVRKRQLIVNRITTNQASRVTIRKAGNDVRMSLTSAPRPRGDCDELVRGLMPTARRIARSYHAPRQQEDLEQVAYLALVKAAHRYR